MCPDDDAEWHATELLVKFPGSAEDFDLAVSTVMFGAIRAAWETGWMPSDLQEIVRRKLQPSASVYLAEAIVLESQRYTPETLHPRWRTDLAAISAGVDPGKSMDRCAALTVVLQVVGLLGNLAVLEPLLPLPGACEHDLTTPVGEVDQKALARVRALLAKAEATEFPEEAETLSAKAQQLMSRYSLHQAVAEHDLGQKPIAAGRRIWIDSPYAGAKALLVQAVASANRCRVVWSEKIGFVTIVGNETELNLVELLTTSLLLQANRAMLAAGRQVSRRDGHARTRPFRQSFLVAYATRIGQRLDTSNTTIMTEMKDTQLLPVLAAHSHATEELTDRLFPSMVDRPMSVTNRAGWNAGRAAADLALFGVHDSIAE